jgi:hypothetical protein
MKKISLILTLILLSAISLRAQSGVAILTVRNTPGTTSSRVEIIITYPDGTDTSSSVMMQGSEFLKYQKHVTKFINIVIKKGYQIVLPETGASLGIPFVEFRRIYFAKP